MSNASALYLNNKLTAALYAIAAVGVASLQDAIVKGISNDFAASQVLFFRGVGALPLLLFLLWRENAWVQMFTGPTKLLIARSGILCAAYLCFILSIAAIPIATSVSIYFTMPFFVAGLAGPALGERVALHRWFAIAAAFIGVLVMINPGTARFEPAMILALLSALGYAVGQLIGRHVSALAPISVISNWQNLVYTFSGLALAVVAPFLSQISAHKSMTFLTRQWIMPDLHHLLILLVMGFLAALGSVLFVSAYKNAEANFVAPFEYTALIWATLYGMMLFNDFPDQQALLGVAIVIAAGVFMMVMDRRLKL